MSRDEFYLPSAIEAIGETPMVKLSRITQNLSGSIYAKLEFLNPGFSKKDRIARQIIEEAENNKTLSPGQTVVELTSGNTGTGLAIVCGIKKYPFVAVMSKGNSMERARMMSALGAEVVLVDQLATSTLGEVSGGDLEEVEKVAQAIVKQRKAFRADQFNHLGNFNAHYLHTGPEMIRQSKGDIDVFCDFVGSGGTYGGCAAALKEFNKKIKCFVVEATGAATLAGKKASKPGHRIQGGGYSRTELTYIKPHLVDGYLEITDEEARLCSHRLAKEEGLFTGFSSGANLAAALQLLNGKFAGKSICITLNDSGLKYVSTDLWQ
jgi:cysteine synthase A